MPRKFGNEIRLPGTTGIDNFKVCDQYYLLIFKIMSLLKEWASYQCLLYQAI